MKHQSKKQISISVGIPAFNEGKNIGTLINAIIGQKTTDSNKIIEIIVVSDGSTDSTVAEVREIRDRKIRMIEGKKREGKNQRINQILKSFKGDILVLFDADIILENKNVINAITQTFKRRENIGLVAGNVQPLPAKTIFDSAFNNFVYSLNFMKSKINSGENVYSVRGPILSLSKQFAKQLTLPLFVPDDRYIYFASIKAGFAFAYEDSAVVWFKSPTTLKEQILQGIRFRKDRVNLNEFFEQNLLDKEYFLPFSLKIQALLFQVFKNPFAYLVMKYIQLRVILSTKESDTNIWHSITSSKTLTL